MALTLPGREVFVDLAGASPNTGWRDEYAEMQPDGLHSFVGDPVLSTGGTGSYRRVTVTNERVGQNPDGTKDVYNAWISYPLPLAAVVLTPASFDQATIAGLTISAVARLMPTATDTTPDATEYALRMELRPLGPRDATGYTDYTSAHWNGFLHSNQPDRDLMPTGGQWYGMSWDLLSTLTGAEIDMIRSHLAVGNLAAICLATWPWWGGGGLGYGSDYTAYDYGYHSVTPAAVDIAQLRVEVPDPFGGGGGVDPYADPVLNFAQGPLTVNFSAT